MDNKMSLLKEEAKTTEQIINVFNALPDGLSDNEYLNAKWVLLVDAEKEIKEVQHNHEILHIEILKQLKLKCEEIEKLKKDLDAANISADNYRRKIEAAKTLIIKWDKGEIDFVSLMDEFRRSFRC
jgi:hypothetical protein